MTPIRRFLLPGSLLAAVATAAFITTDRAGALDDDALLQSSGPDVIVGDIYDNNEYGTLGGKSSYSFGTESCNIGSVPLAWIASTPQHPVIGQEMYRLKDGKFEMIGMSWLKHGFTALNLNLCNICSPTPGTSLGVGCSDPYSAFLNGYQTDLGPRAEVNAYTGAFPYPPTLSPPVNDVLDRRLIVDNADVDPALNGSARYFVEGHYIHPDDNAASGNGWNNMSWREINFSGGSAPWNVGFSGPTQREEPAIYAWEQIDPSVSISEKQLSGDGTIMVAHKATPTANGWEYVYTVYNRDSDRGINAFALPVAPTAQLSNKYFRDVDHHSGDTPDPTDWNAFEGTISLPPVPSGVRVMAWHTQTYAQNPNANAIRWGTSFTFSVEADTPPTQGYVAVRLFKPGAQQYAYIPAVVPQ